mmetsp:Transcript_74414/g.174637  ORF Transcript_74414/g.174637 Transcript_74414/m.174637 type:complete len:258 (+) Transcript_74414:142-915(+)
MLVVLTADEVAPTVLAAAPAGKAAGKATGKAAGKAAGKPTHSAGYYLKKAQQNAAKAKALAPKTHSATFWAKRANKRKALAKNIWNSMKGKAHNDDLKEALRQAKIAQLRAKQVKGPPSATYWRNQAVKYAATARAKAGHSAKRSDVPRDWAALARSMNRVAQKDAKGADQYGTKNSSTNWAKIAQQQNARAQKAAAGSRAALAKAKKNQQAQIASVIAANGGSGAAVNAEAAEAKKQANIAVNIARSMGLHNNKLP